MTTGKHRDILSPGVPGRTRSAGRTEVHLAWPKLKRHVESLVGSPPSPPDVSIDLEPFKAAVRSGDADAVRKLLAETPALRKKIDAPVFEMDLPAVVSARHDRAMVDALLEFG